METVRRTAHHYAALRTLLRNLRHRLPITTGSGTPRSSSEIPVGRALRTRISQWMIRLCATFPYLAVSTAAGGLRLLRSPLALYCLAASVVHVMGAPTDSARAIVTTIWHWAGKPDSLAVISLVAALAAVSLDHGLSSRVRARNAWRRSLGERAEAGLAELSDAAVDLSIAIDTCTEELARRLPFHLGDAMESGTQDLVTAYDGKVQRVAPERRTGRHRCLHQPSHRDWAHESPLLHDRDPWRTQVWEPDKELQLAVTRLNSVVAHYDDTPLVLQAPRSARYFTFLAQYKLIDIDLAGLSRSAWEALGKELYQASTLAVEAAEHAVRQDDAVHAAHKDCLHGPEVPPAFHSHARTGPYLDLARCQRLLDEAKNQCHRAIWDAAVVSADATRFADRIRTWQRPQSLLARFASRFGG